MNPTRTTNKTRDDRRSPAPSQTDRVFAEVGRLQGNVFVFWGLGLLMASITPGLLFFPSHIGSPGNPEDLQLVLSFWAEAEPARTSLRNWLLPMASIVLALMAIPAVSIAPSAEESVDRRAQQVVYLRLQMVSAFALIVTSWLLVPFPIKTPEAVGSTVLRAVVALLASGILAVMTVSSDERRHLMDAYSERLARINAELAKLGAGPSCEPAKWWQSMIRHARFNRHWSTVVGVCSAFAPATIAVYGLTSSKAVLFILVVSVPATWFLSESVNARLKWRWRKPIDPSWHHRLDAAWHAFTFPTFGLVWVGLTLLGAAESWLAYFVAVLAAALSYVGFPWLYPALNRARERQLHERYLQHQRTITIETIDQQQSRLQPLIRATRQRRPSTRSRAGRDLGRRRHRRYARRSPNRPA